jgi:hypothetical protein
MQPDFVIPIVIHMLGRLSMCSFIFCYSPKPNNFKQQMQLGFDTQIRLYRAADDRVQILEYSGVVRPIEGTTGLYYGHTHTSNIPAFGGTGSTTSRVSFSG